MCVPWYVCACGLLGVCLCAPLGAATGQDRLQHLVMDSGDLLSRPQQGEISSGNIWGRMHSGHSEDSGSADRGLPGAVLFQGMGQQEYVLGSEDAFNFGFQVDQRFHNVEFHDDALFRNRGMFPPSVGSIDEGDRFEFVSGCASPPYFLTVPTTR